MLLVRANEWQLADISEQRLVFENTKERLAHITLPDCVLLVEGYFIYCRWKDDKAALSFTRSTITRLKSNYRKEVTDYAFEDYVNKLWGTLMPRISDTAFQRIEVINDVL